MSNNRSVVKNESKTTDMPIDRQIEFVVHIDGVNYPVKATSFDEAIKIAKELAEATQAEKAKDKIEEIK